MIYDEEYISRAYTVEELINILSNDVPKYASIEIVCSERTPVVEVWYDKGTNTVILK
jgi:hypothetical protein